MQTGEPIPHDPESIAIAALGFIAGDEELLPRFLAITGIRVTQIREAASEPGFLAGVLKFILDHEPTLDRFCEFAGFAPESVQRARLGLSGGDDFVEISV